MKLIVNIAVFRGLMVEEIISVKLVQKTPFHVAAKMMRGVCTEIGMVQQGVLRRLSVGPQGIGIADNGGPYGLGMRSRSSWQ